MQRSTLKVGAALLATAVLGIACQRWLALPPWLAIATPLAGALASFFWLRSAFLRPLDRLQQRLLAQLRSRPGGAQAHLPLAVSADQLLSELKRLEAECAHLRQFTATLTRTTQAAVVELDPDLRLVSLNEYGQKLAGAGDHEPSGLFNIFSADELASLREELGKRETVIGRNMSIMTRSGDQIEAELSISRLCDDQNRLTGYVAVIVDITKRKRAETNLRNQIAFSQQIFSSIPEMILITDRTLRITFCNRQTRELLGRPDIEVIGQDLQQRLAPDALENGFDEVVRQVIQSGERVAQINVRNPFVLDEQFVDLLVEPLRSATARIGSLIMIRDISEWRQLTAQLRSLQGFTQRLIHASPFAIISLDPQTRISVWNATAEQMFHLPFSEVFGKNLYQAVPAFLTLRDAIDDVLILQKTVHRNDEVFSLAPAEDLVANVTLYPVTAEESGLVLHLENVSALREMESTLLQAQKMESLGLLTSGIIHDFNNLLSGILGYASLLEQRLEGDEKLRKYASTIIRSGERASELISQILDYARKKVAEKAEIPVNELIRESLDFLAPHLKRIQLELRLEPSEMVIHADRGKLSQVFINLVVNAKDALEDSPDPKIVIGTRLVEVAGHAQLPAGSYVRIDIIDNGCGISQQNLDKVFEPFFTTKNVGKGTGLGLALVRGIIRDYAGHIEIESEIGLGTQIHIFLPASSAPRTSVSVSQDPVAEDRRLGTVLLIDDEEVVREIGTDILHLGHISCICASDGEEGIARFREHRATIGLIILDIEMPKMSGEKVFAAIREIAPEMPILIASGYSKEYLESKVFGKKIEHYIAKPFKVDQLLHQVRTLSLRDHD